MAGKKPFFITGANAKIKVNNKTLAFCVDVSYSININHTTPTVLGMYEPTSVEPLGYVVTGQFSVIRYTANAKSTVGDNNAPNSVNDSGNGLGYWGSQSIEDKLKKGINIPAKDRRADESLNPRKLDRATGFEIEIFQKIDGKQLGVAKIRGARITRADFSLSTNSPAVQTFGFTALYADEDSFLADFSGLGQHFT
jgi:hypothetical protein